MLRPPAQIDRKPLLHDAEQNIGNSVVVYPQNWTATSNDSVGVVVPQTNPARILQLTGGSSTGQTMSIVFTASRLVGAENPIPGFPGPITGILEFGNGGRFTRVEFDIPIGPFTGDLNSATNAVEPQDGGVIVTVPTGIVRAYARYDNLLLAPVLGTGGLTLAQLADHLYLPSGVVVVGPGAPLLVPSPTDPTLPLPVYPEPVLVKAMANYFNRSRAKVYKTVYCYASNLYDPISVPVSSASIIGGYSNYAFFSLPAFTKSVKVLRFDQSVDLDVVLHDGIRPIDYIQLTGGGTAPEIEIIGHECIIGISSLSDSNRVKLLQLVCEIGI